MSFVENLDFLNSNSVRVFPIKEGLSCTSTTGVFKIPEDLMLDMEIAATSDVTVEFYISKMYNYTEAVIIEISDTTNTVLGTFTVTTGTHKKGNYYTYYLAPSSSYQGANGKVAIGSLASMGQLPIGVFSFAATATLLEARCVIPSRNTINRFVVIDEKGNQTSLIGNVKLLARNNLRFRQVGDTVVLDAGDGLGLNKDCEDEAPCITTINNVAPDITGNFTLLGLECATFSPLSSPPGLSLDDTCCKPCMGCDEIGQLTERAIQVEADLLKLRDYFTNLQQLITSFEQLTNYSCEC